MTNTSLAIAADGFSLDTIKNTDDLDALLKAVTAIKDAEKVYIHAKMYRDKAIAYAQLEAAALVRVVDLGGVEKLKKGKLRDAAIWLSKMRESERDHYIRMCQNGMTIDNIYWKIVGKDAEKQVYRDFGYEQRDRLIDELKQTGKVDIGDYSTVMYKKLGAKEGKDIVNGTRIALRDAGGLCIEEGSHVYIKDDSKDKEGIKDCARVRARSIRIDFYRLLEVLQKNKVEIKYEELLGELSGYPNEWDFCSSPFALNVILALECCHGFSNPEELHRAFTEDEGRNLSELFEKYPFYERFIEEAYIAIQKRRESEYVA